MLKSTFTIIFLAAIVVAVGWVNCSKKNPIATATTGTISGVVTDSTNGTAIAGAEVTTSPISSCVTTNTAGQFRISVVNAGTFSVVAFKSDYITNNIGVNVTAGNTATANIALAPTSGSLTLEWITIPAGSFIMGSTAPDTIIWQNTGGEYPQHTVYLDAYQICKYEITNG